MLYRTREISVIVGDIEILPTRNVVREVDEDSSLGGISCRVVYLRESACLTRMPGARTRRWNKTGYGKMRVRDEPG